MMKNFKITKRDLSFLAIGSIAMLVLAFFLNRRDNSATGTGSKQDTGNN